MYNFGVIFDKDGVIVNNNTFHKSAWKAYLKKYRITLDDEQFKAKIYGRTNENILADLYENQLSPEALNAHSEEKEAIFRELFKPHFALTKGLPQFIDILKACRIPCALATNAPQSNIEFTLNMGQLNDFFQSVVNPANGIAPKPAPDIYIQSAQNLNLSPARCVVFEDSVTGIEAAKKAGCKVIGVASTYEPAEIRQADKIIDDFTAITIDELQMIID